MASPITRQSRQLRTSKGMIAVVRYGGVAPGSLRCRSFNAVYQHGKLIGIVFATDSWNILGAKPTFTAQRAAIEWLLANPQNLNKVAAHYLKFV